MGELISIGNEFIKTNNPQLIFNFSPHSDEILFKRGISVVQSNLSEAYRYLSEIYAGIGFTSLENEYFKHFVLIRLIEPCSKIKSVELLEKYFDIKYSKTTAFRRLEELCERKLPSFKDNLQNIAIRYAERNLNFDFSLVFYDVTTLYFQTDKTDELRKTGYSKDNKPHKPQIVIGLVVNRTGFPVYYDIFEGNKFEGKTLLPVILNLKEKYRIKRLTVIADAGMLSFQNLNDLAKNGLFYVVGARSGTLSLEKVQKIAESLDNVDGRTVRIDDCIYSYSKKRASRDKANNDKQVKKAEYYLNNPSQVIKRTSLLKNTVKNTFEINSSLLEKRRLLEGIKGYKTNITDLPDKLLIKRYKDLWHVEQSFRIAKTDLEMRPVFHRKKTAIECHILIVFAALCLTRVIEYKEGVSATKVISRLRDRWTVKLVDKISGNTLEVEINKKPH